MQAGIQTSVRELSVGLIGAGRQGLALLDALFNPADPVPGVRVDALCDIWPTALETALRRARAAGHSPRCHADFASLLAREARLDALIVATPDFSHAPMVLAALERGLHVYCESRLARSAGEATALVRAARRAGLHVQVGYHRRSDPVYRAAFDELVRAGVMGLPVAFHAEHFFVERDRFAPLPPGRILSRDLLLAHGYASMDELRRWRRWRKFGGSPLPDPGIHQIDTMDWMIGGELRSVLASCDGEGRGSPVWSGDAALLFEYEVEGRPVRASYRSGTCAAPTEFGTHEQFLGRTGGFRISQDTNVIRARPEPRTDLSNWVEPLFDFCRYIDRCVTKPTPMVVPAKGMIRVCESCAIIEAYEKIVSEGRKRPYQPHLENFLAAVRGREALNCSAETAYRTECLLDRIDAALCGRAGPAALPPRMPAPKPPPAALPPGDEPAWLV